MAAANSKSKKHQDIYAIEDYQKANFLISSKYRSSLMENKIIAISLANISSAKEDKEGSIIFEVKTAELARQLGMNVNSGSFYTRLRETAESMTGRNIGASDPESKSFHYIAAITESKCANGVFTIKFNSSLNKYVKNLTANYTVLNLPTMLKFDSVYSFRLYELLKSKSYTPKYVKDTGNPKQYHMLFSVSELKLDMGIVNAELDSVRRILNDSKNPDFDRAVEASPEKIHVRWIDFRKKVLDVAVNEINEKTDLHVEYDLIRSGKGGRITSVEFIVRMAAAEEESSALEVEESRRVLTPDQELDFIDEMRDYLYGRWRSADLSMIAKEANYDMSKIKVAAEVLKNQKNVGNPTGFMIAAVRNGYQNSSGTVVLFEDNKTKYDFDELERTILDN